MVFKGLRPFQVMAETGLSESTVYRALASPAGRRYYEMQLQVLRSGERGRNVKTAVDIRDDAKGQAGKTRIEAMKFIEGWDHRGNQQNINVNVGVSVQPGYIVDIGQHRSEAADILQLSGSVKNVLDDQ